MRLLLLLIIFLSSCNWASDHVLDSFNKVDQSLKESNTAIQRSIEENMDSLNAEDKRKFAPLINQRRKTKKMLDALIKRLEELCTEETDLDCTTVIMIKENNYNKLRESFSKLEEAGVAILGTRDTILTNLLSSFEHSAKEMFEMIPAIAGITILNKYQNDCENSCLYVLDTYIKNKKK